MKCIWLYHFYWSVIFTANQGKVGLYTDQKSKIKITTAFANILLAQIQLIH